jgi:hypothetical protein
MLKPVLRQCLNLSKAVDNVALIEIFSVFSISNATQEEHRINVTTISGQKAVHVDTVNLTAVWWFEAVKGRGGSGSRGKIRKSNASKCSVN